MHTEPFNIIARADSGIENVKDLAGKRVNIGNPGSGDRATMQVVMDAFGWNNDSFKLAAELKVQSAHKRCVTTRLMPSSTWLAIQMVPSKKRPPLVLPNWFPLRALRSKRSSPTTLTMHTALYPTGMYSGTDQEVKSFGVAATLVTTEEVSEAVVYNLTKAVFENFDTFTRLHPAFANLKKKTW